MSYLRYPPWHDHTTKHALIFKRVCLWDHKKLNQHLLPDWQVSMDVPKPCQDWPHRCISLGEGRSKFSSHDDPQTVPRLRYETSAPRASVTLFRCSFRSATFVPPLLIFDEERAAMCGCNFPIPCFASARLQTRDAVRKVPTCDVVPRRPPAPLPLRNIGFLREAFQSQEVFPTYGSTLEDTITPYIPAAYHPT